MPYKVPKNRKVIKTIKMSNGSSLTAEIDTAPGNSTVYWFRDGKYITPSQVGNYHYYDSSIKGYRSLEKDWYYWGKDRKRVDTPVYAPYFNSLSVNNNHASQGHADVQQTIPTNNQKVITLRTKGKMNLADVPENMLDSIAVNAGRSGTDFWTDAALIGKESTFGGFSKALGYPIPSEFGGMSPHFLTNNHAYFDTPEDDYLNAVYKKYNVGDDYQLARAEENVKYATEHGQIVSKTPHYSNYVLADAFKRYQTAPTKYNLNQKNYVPMLNGIRTELQGEKQLQNYWNTRGKQEYARGQKEGMAYGGSLKGRSWESLSMAERADIMKLAVEGGVYDLDAIREGYNEYAKGGKIHIKPENKGKFTALKERTGHSATWFKQHGTPAQKKMAVFALNAAKWKHRDGGNLFLTVGPTQDNDPATKDWEHRREHAEVKPRYIRTKKDDEYWEEKNRRNAEAAEELNRRKSVVMSALSNTANSIPFTGSEIAEAAEAQRQEKLDKAHELKLGLDATMTAAELLAAGYGVTRGLTHLNRYMARQATQSTGQAISREAMQNLAKWNRRVAQVDKPQILMNGIGGTADAYQWYTADNNFDAWENGLETGANAAGVVGGMNWFRNLPYLRRIGGDKIDAVLDGLGYGAAAWDVVKNIPPLSTVLESKREESR